MTDSQGQGFPDISDILARKAEGRRELARRSHGEKIAWVEAMRERLAPLKGAREARRAARASQRSAPTVDADAMDR
jgi:hypothetical protein